MKIIVDKTKENKFKKELIKIAKDNNLVQSKYHLNPLEQKFIYKLIEYIQANDFKYKEVTITFENFYKSMKAISNKNITKTEFKEFIEQLQSKRAKIFINDEFVLTQWFKVKGDINYDIIRLVVDTDVFDYIHNLHTKFTELSLQSLYRFDKFYSMRIYELLKQWSTKGKESVIGFELNYLKELLGVENKKAYNVFGNFKARILDSAKEEINKHSELNIIEYKTKKHNKKIEEIYFKVFDSGIIKNEEENKEIVLFSQTETKQEEKLNNEVIVEEVTENQNIGMIYKLNLPTFSQNMKTKVSDWDIERLEKAIKIFKAYKTDKVKRFALLEKIYREDNNFKSKKQHQEEDQQQSYKSKELKFKNFDERTYDYDSLERKLLGWEND